MDPVVRYLNPLDTVGADHLGIGEVDGDRVSRPVGQVGVDGVLEGEDVIRVDDEVVSIATEGRDRGAHRHELAVIVARNEQGETEAFTAVEMTFNPQANLVEYLLCPARISEDLEEKAEEMAQNIGCEGFHIHEFEDLQDIQTILHKTKLQRMYKILPR